MISAMYTLAGKPCSDFLDWSLSLGGAPEPRANQLRITCLEHFNDHAIALQHFTGFRDATKLLEQIAVERAVLELRKRRVEKMVDLAQVDIAERDDLVLGHARNQIFRNILFISDFTDQLFEHIFQ